MTRAGRTWELYQKTIGALAGRYGEAVGVQRAPSDAEETLLRRFSAELDGEDAHVLLQSLPLGKENFRYHLRYISRWSEDRRRLLAEGASFKLLESLNSPDKQGKLKGLQLSGSEVEQRRQVAEHLQGQLPTPEGQGWLAPVPGKGRKVRVYDDRQVVWVYPPGEVEFYEGLHPYVVRSLIARYVPKPGVIADPMAGSGIIAKMATELGHRAWASDIQPAHPFIAQHDLLNAPLDDVLGEQYAEAADLLIVHPPRPKSLKYRLEQYEAWLSDILESCWGAVKAGGHLVLIVPIQSEFDVLAAAQKAMHDSAVENFQKDLEELTTKSHIAVSRDGREGWHFLVVQSPTIEEP